LAATNAPPAVSIESCPEDKETGTAMMLPNWLMQRAALTPERPALITAQHTVTFSDLLERASSTARQLAGLGVGQRDRVALLMRNSLEYVVLMHAIHMRGAILVPINTRLTPSEVAWQVDHAKAKLLIADEANDATAQGALAQRADGFTATTLAESPLPAVPLLERYHLDAVHSILHTSGTSGQPKGAILTFGNVWWSALGSALNLGHHEADRWLACLPMYHIGGLSIPIRSVIYGIPVVLHEGFDAAAVNRAIDEQGVTLISVVAVMLSRLLDERGARAFPATLRCVLLGGGPAPRALLEACAERGVPVVQTYGLTEAASQVATLAPQEALRKLGSAGKPLFPTELRIEQDGQAVAAGTTGEIVVRGPTITPGYLNQPVVTAHTLRDGWLHTGDVGYVDAEGYLYVLDRRTDLIISGGENVYPAEVEAVLLAHPDIVEAGVIGVPDAQWGQVPAALISVRDGVAVNAEAVRTFCRERLARYKVPAYIKVAPSLPRTASGKVLRREIAAHWAALE
jgi:o-succinylbenzoate---CoA ligase